GKAFRGANATGLSRGPLRSTLPTASSGVSGRFVAASVNHHGTSPWHPCELPYPGRLAAPVNGYAAEKVIRDRYNRVR
ncbi:MAG: hypothetical protein R6U98_28500, partial [Pirellulaceae bacterium]